MPANGPGAKCRHWSIETLSLRAILAALALVTTSGCGTTLTPLPIGKPVHIEPDEGILVVETWSNDDIELLLLTGPDKSPTTRGIQKLPSGRHVHLVALPPGDYRWTRLEMPGFTLRGRMYPVRWNIDDAAVWHASVRAGCVSYPGTLILRRSRGGYLSYRVLNRSGELLGTIEELFPDLLSRYPVRYGGAGRDDFLDFYRSELHSRGPPGQRLDDDDHSPPGEM